MVLELGLDGVLVARLGCRQELLGLRFEPAKVDPGQLLAEIEHRRPAEVARDRRRALVDLDLQRRQFAAG